MIRRPPRSTLDRSSAASDVYKRQRVGTSDVFIGDVRWTRGPKAVWAVWGPGAPRRWGRRHDRVAGPGSLRTDPGRGVELLVALRQGGATATSAAREPLMRTSMSRHRVG